MFNLHLLRYLAFKYAGKFAVDYMGEGKWEDDFNPDPDLMKYAQMVLDFWFYGSQNN